MFGVTLALPAAGLSETILSPDTFEAYSAGTTLYFANEDGVKYAAEQYLDQRKVIWSVDGGMCQEGYWYRAGNELCFVYKGRSDAQCWHYLQTDRGQAVRLVGDPPENTIYIVRQDTQPLQCRGPAVGVSLDPESEHRP